jgi:hypothetical protein
MKKLTYSEWLLIFACSFFVTTKIISPYTIRYNNDVSRETKEYMIGFVENDDNIINKDEVIKKIKRCKNVKNKKIKKQNQLGKFVTTQSHKDYVVVADKLDRGTIEHEYFHLIDAYSKRKREINYDSIINYNISKDEYCRISDTIHKKLFDVLIKSLNEKLEDDKDREAFIKDSIGFVPLLNLSKDRWNSLNEKKDYYQNDKEIFVRINLMKLHLERILNSNNDYLYISIVDSTRLNKMINGYFIEDIDGYYFDIFMDYTIILPLIIENPDEISLFF